LEHKFLKILEKEAKGQSAEMVMVDSDSMDQALETLDKVNKLRR
jgi:hypothetical protein